MVPSTESAENIDSCSSMTSTGSGMLLNYFFVWYQGRSISFLTKNPNVSVSGRERETYYNSETNSKAIEFVFPLYMYSQIHQALTNIKGLKINSSNPKPQVFKIAKLASIFKCLHDVWSGSLLLVSGKEGKKV